MENNEIESQLAELLSELSDVQDELLEVLASKRNLMATNDLAAMTALQPQEEQLCERLQTCQDRRADLIRVAEEKTGKPVNTLRQIVAEMPGDGRDALSKKIDQSAARSRLLQHQGLTNWVLAQLAVLHLSQLLEIIGSGGRLQPTYGRSEESSLGGALVDKEV